MKRSLAVGLVIGILAPVTLGATISWGAETNRSCWDEYDMSGRFYRTVVPKGIKTSDCKPGAGCYSGYSKGKIDRLYVPYKSQPRSACATAPTSTSTTTVPAAVTGRFALLPVGSALPGDADCANRVRRMSENRPDNAAFNATAGTRPNANNPRVTGGFTGTTDEIIQWTACKWGIEEDLVRAQIAVESNWRQQAIGDFTIDSTACIPGVPLGNYAAQYNGDRSHDGECPESIGMGQVRWLFHQTAFADDNATRSTAYNLDYTYSIWRDCYEGRLTWLNTVEGTADYAAGDARGCLGVWFSGRWYTDAAKTYIARVEQDLANRIWEQSWFGPAQSVTAPPSTTAVTNTTTTTSVSTTVAATTTTPTTTTLAAPSTTAAPTTVASTLPSSPPVPGSPPVASGSKFVATFDGNGGLDQFNYGVYHRCVGANEAGTAMPAGIDNNCGAGGTWTADHDLACGSPATQRTLTSDWQADTTGANGWRPLMDFHTDQLVYTCRDHLMTSMGDIAGYSVVWFSPDQVFNSVSSVSFDVNLTDLGTRQWWKVAVVSDTLFNSTYDAGYLEVPVPGFLISDAGTSELNGIIGPDRLVASWSGAASAGYPGAMKVADNKLGCGFDAGTDKATRHPVTLTDNHNGTITFSVAGSTCTTTGSFPPGPVRVVFYDHNYNPDKDGTPIGHTWHWDNIIVR